MRERKDLCAPLIFLTSASQVICNELKKLSVKQKFETSDWLIKPGNFLRPENADADPAPFEPFDSRTMHWYGPDKHYWFARMWLCRRKWTETAVDARLHPD